MNADQRIFLIGLYINSALYLGACAVICFLTGNDMAWRCAVTAMGFCWGGYYGGVDGRIPRLVAYAVGIASILFGLAAGLLLLFNVGR